MDEYGQNESLVFYRSFYDAYRQLKTDQAKIEFIDAIMEYALNNNQIHMKHIGVLFTLIKPQLDANLKRRKNGKKGAESGKKGGRPNKLILKEKPQKNPIGVLPETPNVNANANVNVNGNANVYSYQGVIFRLTHEDKQRWLKTYSRLGEKKLIAEIQKAEDYYRSKGEIDNIFFKISSWLERANSRIEPKPRQANSLSLEDLNNAYD